MALFDSDDHYEPIPLWIDIIGGAIWAACVIGWTAIIVAIGVLV